jgi:hypothetical protein
MNMNNLRLPNKRSRRVLRRRALHSESSYREVSREGPMVELEVLSAPGLRPGTHLRVTSAAVRGMMPHRRNASDRLARGAATAMHFVAGHRPKLRLPTA